MSLLPSKKALDTSDRGASIRAGVSIKKQVEPALLVVALLEAERMPLAFCIEAARVFKKASLDCVCWADIWCTCISANWCAKLQ